MNNHYIKFDFASYDNSLPAEKTVSELNSLRCFLYGLHLIGSSDGIGFGNLSMKTDDNQIVISASATGMLEQLDNRHYVTIHNYDIKNNYVQYRGQLSPSSETLTHLAIYNANPNIKYVAHIHSKSIWNQLKSEKKVTLGSNVFGTVEFAEETYKYILNNNKSCDIFALSGHIEGVIIYSERIESIRDLIKQYI